MTTAPLIFHVKENVPGALIGQVLPHNDTAVPGTEFLIVNQQDVPDVAIMSDGTLYAPQGLDRETRQNYSITVIADSSRGVGVFQVKLRANQAAIAYRMISFRRFKSSLFFFFLTTRTFRCDSSSTTKMITHRSSRRPFTKPGFWKTVPRARRSP
jgi:hypothetical protein